MKLKTKDMILVSLFTALTAIGAFIKIPVGPAPITLQFLFTALAAILLGSKLGAISQLLYVILGLIGIPIFTSGGGIFYIFNPTFGYLIGFIIGAYIIGKILEKSTNPSFLRLFLSCLCGLIIIYALGVPYLYFVLKNISGKGIQFSFALKSGFLIFIPGDVLKSLLTAFIGSKVLPILNKSQMSLN